MFSYDDESTRQDRQIYNSVKEWLRPILVSSDCLNRFKVWHRKKSCTPLIRHDGYPDTITCPDCYTNHILNLIHRVSIFSLLMLSTEVALGGRRAMIPCTCKAWCFTARGWTCFCSTASYAYQGISSRMSHSTSSKIRWDDWDDKARLRLLKRLLKALTGPYHLNHLTLSWSLHLTPFWTSYSRVSGGLVLFFASNYMVQVQRNAKPHWSEGWIERGPSQEAPVIQRTMAIPTVVILKIPKTPY